MSLGSGLLAAILAGTVGVAAVQEPDSPPEAGAAPTGQITQGAREAAPQAGSVTLVTGDRVIVTGKSYRVEPGSGRQVRYATQHRDGHLLVFPSDAMPLVAEGVLDERLFDVTQLLEWRYGDADRPDIPMITQSAQGLAPAPRAARQTRPLAHLGMTALRVPKADAGETWKDLIGGPRTLAAGKTRLWLDGRRSFALDESVKQIGASEAWKQGLTGKGVTVAVLDSGYDADHPDLKDVVTQARNFSDTPDMRDDLGHGTHVASIIAGAGEKYRGVAPDAKLAVGKVGDDSGMTDSAVLAGMEWAAVEVKAKIINMSLAGQDTPELDPLEQAVNTLSAQTGALFVTAAGNAGDLGMVESPASADAALAVGAVDRSDQVAEFSGRGPRVGDHAIKPDITAPGVGIMAAAAKGTADGPYVAHSGTSMATPHVAGAAAILAQRHPDWTGERLKAALIGTAKPTADATPYQQGAGRVDLVRGLAQPVVAVPGNVWAVFPWQDSGTRETTRTITYTNSGDAPVTLDLSTESDVLTLSAERLEVPAGGDASVTLTINTDGKTPGDYPGIVSARSGDTVIRTLAGAYVEPKSSDVTITVIARDGKPATAYGQVYNLETGGRQNLPFRNGVAKVRLPAGQWNLYAELMEQSSIGLTAAHVPLKVDDADREVVLDARQGKQVRFSLDEPTAVPDRRMEFNLANGSWSFGWLADADPNRDFFMLPVRQPGLRYMTRSIWYKKDAVPSPYRYDLVDYRTGGIPDDPSYTARTSDLVKVTATYRASGTAARGAAALGPRFPGSDSAFLASTPAFDLPGTMTHYRTPGFTWDTQFRAGTYSVIGIDRYEAGRAHREVWNAAVAGPAFATSGGARTGNELGFSTGRFFSDGVAGRTGTDASVTGTVTLAKSGEVIARADLADCETWQLNTCLTAELPADAATYTLTAAARRQGPHTALSTAVDAVWTFRSASTAKPQPLPLMAVRYTPAGLDDSNRAKPGSLTQLPIWIERNPGAPKATVKSVKLEVSSDDGATWRPVPVLPAPSGWTALLANPGTPGFVSLRATATDAAGDRVTQTITRAYAVG
ncbi:subtilisin family serine protease [Streptosporangium album]|uniref:Subtilisin family serine protease n=1 Tax=Streptosporangium album TaxID=47479 RepID=A0A7W7S455_9ACTN|nr:S8 family serine peptidase [Streptosporangium album]MBB4943548.1 subtilisin family serine protease [Streptosporangium album]